MILEPKKQDKMPRFAGCALVCILLVVATTARVAVADDFFSPLSPLLSPVINSICNTVACGKGNCTVSPGRTLGYKCECDPGWTQLHVSDELSFLPCVIPNCTIDHSCSNVTLPPVSSPLQSPKNVSPSIDSCSLAYCGTGGTCRKDSGLSYHCECEEGFSNLLNITTLPCFHNCSFGADCASIGLFPNSSRSPAPSASSSTSDTGSAAALGSISLNSLLQLLIFVFLAMVQAI